MTGIAANGVREACPSPASRPPVRNTLGPVSNWTELNAVLTHKAAIRSRNLMRTAPIYWFARGRSVPKSSRFPGRPCRTNRRTSEQAGEDVKAMMIRILGASLVSVSVLAIVFLREMVTAVHPSTTPELLLSVLIVATGLPGLAMTIEGPSLLGYCEPPTRSR
jgi:hypothetical protein